MFFKKLKNHKGYTLVELMATMVIMGVIASVAAKKVKAAVDLGDTVAKNQVVRELNVRSLQTWLLELVSNGYTNDNVVFNSLDKNLTNVTWDTISKTGGRFKVMGKTYEIVRTPSIREHSATWK